MFIKKFGRSNPYERFCGAIMALALSFVCLPLSGQALAQIVTNGGFGTTGSTGNLPGSAPSGWTYVAGNGSGCLIAGSNFTGCGFSTTNPGNSPNGGNYVAISTNNTSAAGTIQQTIGALIVGTRYTLSFFVGQEAAGSGPIRWTVTLGGVTLATIVDSVAGWTTTPIAITFTATAPQSNGLLAFAASTTSGGPPVASLDGVSIPEPGSIALFGLGALGMVGLHRRKKARAA